MAFSSHYEEYGAKKQNGYEEAIELSCPRPREFSELSKNGKASENGGGQIFQTDKIIKFFVCIFYGIIPNWFQIHNKKAQSMFVSVVICILHWYAVWGYVYCHEKFWSNNKQLSVLASSGNYTIPSYARLPEIPKETLLLLVGLATSSAVTVTMTMHYFYRQRNNFTRRGSFSLLPEVKADDDFKTADLGKKEWLATNIIFLTGIATVVFIIGTNVGTNTMFSFQGIRAFLSHTTTVNKILYSITFAMLLWGFVATICACCMFHIMARLIIVNIEETQRLIFDTAESRDDFFLYHERLLKYKDKMIGKFKYWFALHSVMFMMLVGTMIFEWVAFMKNAKYRKHNLILSQISGSLLVFYKFAFPFISASLVTVKFKDFYLKIARSNKFKDIPELLLLHNYFGFDVFGLRITPNYAVFAFLSSFVGFLKYASAQA